MVWGDSEIITRSLFMYDRTGMYTVVVLLCRCIVVYLVRCNKV
jgi:hypothetical protein